MVGATIHVQLPARRVGSALVECLHDAQEPVQIRSLFAVDVDIVGKSRMAFAQGERGVEVTRVEHDQGVLGSRQRALRLGLAIIPLPSKPGELQLGYSLLPQYWGKGYATELAMAGLDFFKRNFLVPVIYAVTEVPNVASQKVLLKAGFEMVGPFEENKKELLLFKVQR